MRKPVPERVDGPAALDRLTEFTRRILAVKKEEIADTMRKPVYRPRKPPKRKRRSTRSTRSP